MVYRVRPVSQHGLITTDDPHENRACWYAAALMVLSHRGPLLPLELANVASAARLWKNHGVQPHRLDRLAQEAGLEHAAAKTLFPRMGAAQWHAALSTLGPLMVVLTSRHLVVVTGIAKRGAEWDIVYNDPFTGTEKRDVLVGFNRLVDWWMPMLWRRSAHRPPAVLRQPVTQPLAIRY